MFDELYFIINNINEFFRSKFLKILFIMKEIYVYVDKNFMKMFDVVFERFIFLRCIMFDNVVVFDVFVNLISFNL